MKKQIVLYIFIIFFSSTALAKGYELFVVNKSDIQVEIRSSVYQANSLNVNTQHFQTDRFGLFLFAKGGDKVGYMCTESDKKATHAVVMWKYAGAFGIKTQWHVMRIEPIEGTLVFYLFKDGLVALHNVTKNLWQYKRIPMDVVGVIPVLKDLIKEQNFSKTQFIEELNRVAKRLKETVPKDPFSLSSEVKKGVEQGFCPILGKEK